MVPAASIQLSAAELSGKLATVRYVSGTSGWNLVVISIETVNNVRIRHPDCKTFRLLQQGQTTTTALPISTYDVDNTNPSDLACVRFHDRTFR